MTKCHCEEALSGAVGEAEEPRWQSQLNCKYEIATLWNQRLHSSQ